MVPEGEKKKKKRSPQPSQKHSSVLSNKRVLEIRMMKHSKTP